MYTAFLIEVEPHNGIGFLQEFIQTTFAKRGITITHFHDTIYQKTKYNRIATIKFNFYIETYKDRSNNNSYASRILYRLNKYADEEAQNNPSILPFEVIHTPDTRESWVVKLIRPM